MKRLLDACSGISRGFAWLGGALLLVSAALVSLDVVFRALFKVTFFESFELSTYAFAIATGLGMSYAMVTRAHIRIELLYTALPVRRRAWLDVFAYVGLALCAGVMLYWCGQMVFANWQSGARSNSSLAIRLAVPQGLWLLGLAWFAVLAVLYTAVGLWNCLQGRPDIANYRLGMGSLREEIEVSTAMSKAAEC